ncbi:MAG: ATP-grasp domain-containing protein [Fimbriimonadaceae bacterium]
MKYDIGFLGGGQLARMSVMTAASMGLRCVSLDPSRNSPAAQVGSSVEGNLDDPAAIAELASKCEVLTLENEFVPVQALREGLKSARFDPSRLFPSMETLEVIQDKYRQKRTLLDLSVPSPKVWLWGQKSSISFPVVAKSRFGGYDGRGTIVAREQSDLDPIRNELESETWMLEEYVPFVRELAVMVILREGAATTYPTVQSVQVNQVCDHVMPCEADATEVAVAAARAVSSFGLFGVELFQTDDGAILVNEIAPRPHNSGHYTMDTGGLSQFEALACLAMGWRIELSNPREVCMVNLFGQGCNGDFREAISAGIRPNVRFHWYGKEEAKKGRKMGHINSWGPNALATGLEARDSFYRKWCGS